MNRVTYKLKLQTYIAFILLWVLEDFITIQDTIHRMMRASRDHCLGRAPRTHCKAQIFRSRIICASSGSVPDARVVVIGGTGRVGSSTASALIKEFPNLQLTLASRNEDSYHAAVSRRPELSKAAFQRVDITNADSVRVR